MRISKYAHKVCSLILCICMAMLSGCDCSNVTSKDLMQAYQVPDAVTSAEAPSNNRNAEIMDFAIRLFQSSYAKGDNALISPISMLFSLGMSSNGAAGSTQLQMEDVFGLSVTELNQQLFAYQKTLSETEPCQISIANGMWLKTGVSVETDFLEANHLWYNAGVYEAPFNQQTATDISQYVAEKTHGKVNNFPAKFSENTVMYLVNALYFEAEWAYQYVPEQIETGTFTTEDGSEESVQVMKATEYQYMEDDYAQGFIKHFEGDNYAFAALLPQEGISIKDYIMSLSGAHLLELLENAEWENVFVTMPEYTACVDRDFSNTLQSMGMVNAFNPALSDFSALGAYQGNSLFIGSVQQKAFLDIGPDGAKAGTATAVEIPAGSLSLDMKYLDFTRPFIYVIFDCQSKIPLFIGALVCMK